MFFKCFLNVYKYIFLSVGLNYTVFKNSYRKSFLFHLLLMFVIFIYVNDYTIFNLLHRQVDRVIYQILNCTVSTHYLHEEWYCKQIRKRVIYNPNHFRVPNSLKIRSNLDDFFHLLLTIDDDNTRRIFVKFLVCSIVFYEFIIKFCAIVCFKCFVVSHKR